MQVLQNSAELLHQPRPTKIVSQRDPLSATRYQALYKAADPEIISHKAEVEAIEMNKVEQSMTSAFNDFERKLRMVHSKIESS